jgi:RNase P/RNase MRP subunit p30
MNQIIIKEENFEKARRLIKENRGKKIIFISEDDELNRKILEKEDIEILLLNQKGRKDFQKQRNSGFNHVLAKLAKKKKIIVGINLDEIVNSNEKEKSLILARVRQNIKICNKNKLKMKFISENNNKNIPDLKALGLILGMPTWMTKEL